MKTLSKGPGRRRVAQRLAVAAAVLLTATLVAESAVAGPQWRQRRWLSRPPIDPTIRVQPRFQSMGHPPAYRVPARYVPHQWSPAFRRGVGW